MSNIASCNGHTHARPDSASDSPSNGAARRRVARAASGAGVRAAAAALAALATLLLLWSCATPSTTPPGLEPVDLHAISWQELAPTEVHDPSLIRAPSGWYLYYTGYGVLSKRSPNGLQWLIHGKVLDGTPAWAADHVPGASPNLWAPDISYYDGRYWLYYSVSRFGENTSAIGLGSSPTLDEESEDYGWVDLGRVIASQSTDDYNAIDPNLAVDADGEPWLAFGSHWSGIKIVRLDPETMKPAADAELHSIAARPEETAIEAPYIVHRDGWYYLFVSFDRCCRGVESTYKIAVGRSRTIDGGYVDRDGVPMTEGGGTIIRRSGERWIGPGHNAVYTEGGRSILVYHAYDAENGGRATLRIEPLYWDEAGWPSVEGEM